MISNTKSMLCELCISLKLINSCAVFTCAVSPAGDRIYVTNRGQHKLLTLAIDGTLISTFNYPELKYPRGVHVTPAGQVLVCTSKNVIQVNREGKKKLATLLSQKDDDQTLSICYNKYIDRITVGTGGHTIFDLKRQ
ncbi:hypothetical protein DPMN_066654 [Dreissena polymorpha]|uniref:Uncharacterized protein n=1 Tax=Dreissena polymorpha TaxID=45954 RepID=A0A9D4BS82_DREPO|nr:hypothetical protein DPMN_066654 [Dreissena polymorpha]